MPSNFMIPMIHCNMETCSFPYKIQVVLKLENGNEVEKVYNVYPKGSIHCQESRCQQGMTNCTIIAAVYMISLYKGSYLQRKP